MDSLVISIPKHIELIDTFSNLWKISFAYCSKLPSLSPLSRIIFLGFLDFSFTDIKPSALINSISDVHILRLNIFGIPAASNKREARNYFVLHLPRVWILNGLYVSDNERTKQLNSHRHSVLAAKYPADKQIFSEKEEADKIWSEPAKVWIQDMPRAPSDSWKLDRLATSLHNTFFEDGKLIHEMLVPLFGSNSKSIASLYFILGTWTGIPIGVLHQSFVNCLDIDIVDIKTPLIWSAADRISLMGMLAPKISLDKDSVLGNDKQAFDLDDYQLDFLFDFVQKATESRYPEVKPVENFILDEYHNAEEGIEFEFSEIESKVWATCICGILELCCLYAGNSLFVMNIDSLEIVLKHALNILSFSGFKLVKGSSELSVDAEAVQYKVQCILAIRAAVGKFKESILSEPLIQRLEIHS